MKKTDINKVKCVIFQSKNEIATGITKALNEAEALDRKARLAKRLIEETEGLLSCAHFNEKRADCRVCHSIAKLRKQTANLILKVKQLKTNK